MFLHAGRTRLLVGATTVLFFHSCQVVWTTSDENQTQISHKDAWQQMTIDRFWKSSTTRTVLKIHCDKNNFENPPWQEQFLKSATTTILKIHCDNNNFENPPPGLSFHLTWAVSVVSVRLTSFQGSNVLLTFLLEVCEPLIESDVAPNFQPEYQLIVHLPRLLLNGIPRHVTVSSSRRQLYDKVFSR